MGNKENPVSPSTTTRGKKNGIRDKDNTYPVDSNTINPKFDPADLAEVTTPEPITPAGIVAAAVGESKGPAIGDVNLFNRLWNVSQKIIEASQSDIVFTPPWVTYDDAPIFSRGTVNLIQGKHGSHKSRLAEHFCALLLNPKAQASFAGFEKQTKTNFVVAYIDTERLTHEGFAAAVQRIRIQAGYDKDGECPYFFPTSIKTEKRQERQTAVKTWIEGVRGEMKKHSISEWGLLVVLDVVTDCVSSFNSEDQTLLLFDFLGNQCEEHGVSFLLVLHENPGTEKARGHTGTEAANKADTAIQIGYDGDETDLIKVKFIKTRQSARPKPVYLQYSQEVHSLVSANPAAVAELYDQKRKSKDTDLLIETLVELFDDCEELERKTVVDALVKTFECAPNTALNRLSKVIEDKVEIHNKLGQTCHLSKIFNQGKSTIYFLSPVESGKEITTAETSDLPF